jgi:dTDP-4-amino-4,6-dideoxygalactose transaminase
MIRLNIPAIDEAEISAAAEVLRSGYLVQGKCVAAFEVAIAKVVEVKHAVAVSSGTAALHLALRALDIGPGHRVITTAYSWPATANAVELCGARPVFVDVDKATFNIDPYRLEEACAKLRESSQPARAILPVHAFGQPADMTAITDIGRRYNLPVVEDAACALGARWRGRPAGGWGQLGCFSFHPRKAITTGEGGMITTSDDGLADRLRMLRNHGLDLTSNRPDFLVPGFNYRLSEIAAAVGEVQLSKLEELIRVRREKALVYDGLLEGSGVQTPAQAAGAESVFQSYVVQVPFGDADEQLRCIEFLRQQGIEATIGTHHIPLTRYYRERYGFQAGDYPCADHVFRHAVTLPLHHRLDEAAQHRVVGACLAFLNMRRDGLAAARLASAASHLDAVGDDRGLPTGTRDAPTC